MEKPKNGHGNEDQPRHHFAVADFPIDLPTASEIKIRNSVKGSASLIASSYEERCLLASTAFKVLQCFLGLSFVRVKQRRTGRMNAKKDK
jgi:hypothetical protein